MEAPQYIEYVPKSFGAKARDTIAKADRVIKDYTAQGYTLTLRQLYYQFVSREWIENSLRSYKNLGVVVTDARLAGLLPWNGIEDTHRKHHGVYANEDLVSVYEGLEGFYSVNPWDRQNTYIELWVEKEALGNVIERPCKKFRVPYMACKGYLSASQAWRAGERYAEALDRGKHCVLIHLGDHDPSGIDMTRDNENRLRLFAQCDMMGTDVEVRRIALNMDQVNKYNPPPNPAKLTDSRATGYIQKFGKSSWELDALEPKVIDELITDTIEGYIDPDTWESAMDEEKTERKFITTLHRNFAAVEKFVRRKM